jgi:hypothetical protein
MRIRINYTLEVDVDQYCEAMEADLEKEVIRKRVQDLAQRAVLQLLKKRGVRARMIGVNNVYDPIQKLTVAAHLVKTARQR